MGAVVGFLEHPAVEMEPGELPVDEPIRTVRQLARTPVRTPQRSGFFRPNSGLSAICHNSGSSVMNCHNGRASCLSHDMSAPARPVKLAAKFVKMASTRRPAKGGLRRVS